MTKGVLCLAVYAVLWTIVQGVTSYFLSLKCKIKSTVNGNENQIKNENKYDISSVDFSKDDKKCSKWSSMGTETFEIILLVTLVLTLAHWMGRRTYVKKGWMAKRKEAKKQSEAKKFERFHRKFEQSKESSPKNETKENTQDKKVEKTG